MDSSMRNDLMALTTNKPHWSGHDSQINQFHHFVKNLAIIDALSIDGSESA